MLQRLGASQVFFKNLIEKYPQSAEVHLYAGMTNDNLGREQKAIPLYKKALDLGLKEPKELRDCLICLSSTYRVEGLHEKSLETIETARTEFPRDPVVSCFLALALCEVNQSQKAVKELGLTLMRESGNPGLGDFNFGKPLIRYFSSLADD